MPGEPVLRFCETCGRKTAHDAARLLAGAPWLAGEIPLTVHYCSVHPGAQSAAVQELARMARELRDGPRS
jgi:hypothetical protein